MAEAEEYGRVPRPRKRKVIFTKEQTARLEGVFKMSRYPDITVIEALAQEIGVAMEKISNWFQNKRAREKRNQAADHRRWMKEQFYQSQASVHSQGDHVISPRQSQNANYNNMMNRQFANMFDRKPIDLFQHDLNENIFPYAPPPPSMSSLPSMPLAPLLPHNAIVPSSLSPTQTHTKPYTGAPATLALPSAAQYSKPYVPSSLSPTSDYGKLYAPPAECSVAGVRVPHQPMNDIKAVPATPQMSDPQSPAPDEQVASPDCSTPALMRSFNAGTRPQWPVSPLSQPTSPDPVTNSPYLSSYDYTSTSASPTSLKPPMTTPLSVQPTMSQPAFPMTSLQSNVATSLPSSLSAPMSSLPYPTTSSLTSPSYTLKTTSPTMPTSVPSWFGPSEDLATAGSASLADMNYYYHQPPLNYPPMRNYDLAANYPAMTGPLPPYHSTNPTMSYMGHHQPQF